MDLGPGNQGEQNRIRPWRDPQARQAAATNIGQQCLMMMGLRDRDIQGKRSHSQVVRELAVSRDGANRL